MKKFTTSADIKYLSGFLAGVTIPAGQRVSFSSRKLAQKHAGFLQTVKDSSDFIRCAGTGDMYEVLGNIEVSVL